MMRSRVFAISKCVGIAALMQACVIVPLPNEKLLTDDKLGQLVVGSTTRDQVYATLGDQYWQDSSGSRLVYSNDRVIAFVATAWGGGTMQKVENLYIDFDDRNILTHLEPFEFIDGKACVENGVCMIGNIRDGNNTLSFISFSQPPDEDRQAKQFNVAHDQCSVYLYGDASLKSTYKLSGALHQVCLNDKAMTALYSPDLFINWHLPPGTHQLAVGNAYMWDYSNGLVFNRDAEDLMAVSQTLECEPGAVHFLRIEESAELKGIFAMKYAPKWFALDTVDEQTGRAAVTTRSLATDALDSRTDLDIEHPDTEKSNLICRTISAIG